MKLTTAQLWLVHTLETLFFGAIVTGGISVYQALGTGNYDAQALAAIFIPAFVAVLAKGSSAVISNNNTFQAGEDTLKQLTASHEAMTATLARSIVVQQAPVVTPQVTMSAHPVQQPQAPVAPPQAQQTAAPMQPAMQSSQPVASPGVSTAMLQSQVAPVVLPQRDAWSNSSLMQAIGKPPQQG